MEREEYINKIININNEITNLEKNKKDIIKDYVNEHSKFKVGDVIIITDFENPYTFKSSEKIGIITRIYCDNDELYIKGIWKTMNKDGTFSKKETYISYNNLLKAKLYNGK